MNHVYRIIWSVAANTYIAVAETAGSRGKRGLGKRMRALRALRALALAASLITGANAMANPTGGAVSAGQGSIFSSGTVTTINQTTPKMAINWQGFNIAAGETVNFVQPGSSAVALNRVLGTDGSQLLGRMNANGQVYILNPNGVLFGKDAQVSVGALVASTLQMSDSDFMTGKMTFSGQGGAVTNYGNIAANGGYVSLLGGQVTNQGTITAKLGTVALGAGQKITLDFSGDGLLKLAVDQGLANALTDNRGLIQADGGSVIMAAQTADALRASVVNNEGVIQARSLENHGGVIRLAGTQVLNTGTLDAVGIGNTSGGKIAIEAAYLTLNTGSLNASGAQGGRISVKTHNLVEAGQVDARGAAQGGSITLSADAHIEQTSASMLRADGDNGGGGAIRIEAGSDAWLSGGASANAGKGRGGEIAVTASDLVLAGAQLSAVGSAGGGRIRIGGGWQGQDADLANAARTRVVASRFDTSAGLQGDGGTVVLWSDKETLFGGDILATGGATGGNGGKAEVSSHGQLNYGGKVDLRASVGQAGQLLLDPKNIEIVDQVTGTLVLPLQDPNASPSANQHFGADTIVQLSNGGTPSDTVIIASQADNVGASSGGAVRMFSTQTAMLGATLIGTSTNDQVGKSVVALTNGNYVVASPFWSGGGTLPRGAVTWGSGLFGVSGSVSALNSWIGTTDNDQVGNNGVTALANGNFVIASPSWDSTLANVGAVTWVNGAGLSSGTISSANSLIGAKANDAIGNGGVTALANGNYVVLSLNAANNAVNNTGAVTLLNGAAMSAATVSTANSLMGSTTGDFSTAKVTPLRNSNFVLGLPLWNIPASTADVGAVSWIAGTTGGTRTTGVLGSGIGTVSASNSLVGIKVNDMLSMTVTPLEPPVSGSDTFAYVLAAPNFDSPVTNGGAVALVNGNTGKSGQIATGNSLLGAKAGDQLGSGGITALTNGNYVIVSPNWQSATNATAGAVTWRDAAVSTSGTLAAAAAGLTGSIAGDMSNVKVTPLKNGQYVVATPNYDLSAVDIGAVTWRNGTSGTTEPINATISMIGSTTNDQIGSGGVRALANGNYVFASPNYDANSVVDAGAVMLASGNGVTAGSIAVKSKVVGSTIGDKIGEGGLTALTNGNYVISSPSWHNASNVAVGAVTWGDGGTVTNATVAVGNSLVGSTANDLAAAKVVALAKGDYLVLAPKWDKGPIVDAGAVTLGKGTVGVSGITSDTSSFVGQSTNDNAGQGTVTVLADGRAVVGSPNWNINGATAVGRVDIFGEQSGTNFYINPTGTSTFLASDLVASLGTVQNLTLQANNDINVRTALNFNNSSGNSGKLSMQAGRSILLEAGIVTGNRGLEIVANDAGALSSYRDSGAATISMTGGATIVAGTGEVQLTVRNSTSGAGDISLRGITASKISVINEGTATSAGIVLNGPLSATGGSSLGIELAGQRFQNNAGLAALTTAPGSRWLVWSGSPVAAGEDRGGLAYDFKQYNAQYGTSLPASSSGNGVLYAIAPRLEVGLTGTVSKAYDGTANATVNPANLAFTGGTIDGDVVILNNNNPMSGSYLAGLSGAAKDVGNSKDVSVSGFQITSAHAGNNAAVPVFGYGLMNSAASAGVGVITPYVVSLNGARAYDGSTSIAASVFAPALAVGNLVNNESLTLSGTATAASKDVGGAALASPGNLLLADGGNGGLASNYTLSGGVHTANIAPFVVNLNGARPYDGTTSIGAAVLASSLATGNLVNNESLNLSGSGTAASKDAGNTVLANFNNLTLENGSNGGVSSNYTLSGGVHTATITPFVVSLNGTRPYDGTTSIAASVLASSLAAGKLVNNESLNLSGSGTVTGKDAGSAALASLGNLALADGANGGVAGNYTFSGGVHTANITPFVVSLNGARPYDGTTSIAAAVLASSLATGNLVNNESLNLSGSGTAASKDAGSTVLANFSNLTLENGSNGGVSGNYTLSGGAHTTTITPFVVSLNGVRAYDGTTSIAASVLAPSLAAGKLVNNESLTLSGSGSAASRDAGSAALASLGNLTLANGVNGGLSGNYTLSGGTHTATITQAGLTLSTEAVSKIYDGTLAANGAAVVVGGSLVTGDTLSGGSYAYLDKNAGSGKSVSVSGITVNDGNGGGNYAVNYVNNTGSVITPAPLTLSSADVNKVYDGGLAAKGTPVVTSGSLFGDTLSGGTYAYLDRNAGSGKSVSASAITVNDGNGGGNYAVSYVNNTHSVITPAPLTLSTGDVSKVYDGTLAANGTPVVASGTLFGDTINGGTYAYLDKNAGTGKSVSASAITVNDGNGGANYAVSYVNNTHSVITPAPLTLSTGDVSKVYDGGLAATGTPVVTSGTLLGDTLSGGTYAYLDKNAGSGKSVSVSGITVNDGNGGGNYAVSYVNNTNSVITPAPLMLSTGDVSKVYDGTLAANGTPVVISGTLFGDTINGGTYAYLDRNAGSGKSVSANAITVNDGNGGGNYAVSYVNNTNSVITPAPLALSTTTVNKLYDGNVSAAGTPLVIGGTLYGGDTISDGSFAFTDRYVGNNKTVVVSNIKVNDGNGGANYSVSTANNTSSSISPSPQLIAATEQSGAIVASTLQNPKLSGADRRCILDQSKCIAALAGLPLTISGAGMRLPESLK